MRACCGVNRGWVGRVRAVAANPFFRHEVGCPGRRAWRAGLALANTLYVLLFLAARLAWEPASAGSGAPRLTAPFDYTPWLLGGAVLLSLSAHWLVPPFLLRGERHRYDLRTLRLMVQGRHTEEEVLEGQVAGRVAPLVLGAAPLLAGAVLLSLSSPVLGAWSVAALLAAALWGALSTCVSVWAGASSRAATPAALRAYALTCVALPLAIGAVTLFLAWGCSIGHPRSESVFAAAAGLTWSILVIGAAALFWDVASGCLFPEKRVTLWQDASGPARLEP